MVIFCVPEGFVVKNRVPCVEDIMDPREIPPAETWKAWFGGRSVNKWVMVVVPVTEYEMEPINGFSVVSAPNSTKLLPIWTPSIRPSAEFIGRVVTMLAVAMGADCSAVTYVTLVELLEF